MGLEPVLVILAIDKEETIHIFYYHVTSKQILQVVTNTSINNKISKASITQDPFDVVRSYFVTFFNKNVVYLPGIPIGF